MLASFVTAGLVGLRFFVNVGERWRDPIDLYLYLSISIYLYLHLYI